MSVSTDCTLSLYILWNLSNPDTNGAKESVNVSEVSSFQRFACKSGTWVEKVSCLERCLSSVQECPYRGVPLYVEYDNVL